MNKKQTDRANRLLPNGIPKYIRIYDNGGLAVDGGTADRYTVVFTGNYTHNTGGEHQVLGMSGEPYHPQGVCLHSSYREQVDAPGPGWPPAIGRKCHLGTRIRFSELPKICQHVVLTDYSSLWDIPGDFTLPLLEKLLPTK